jgi:hypothetical protein
MSGQIPPCVLFRFFFPDTEQHPEHTGQKLRTLDDNDLHNVCLLIHGNQFWERMVLQPLFPTHSAPERTGFMVGCVCGASGGASPLRNAPEN